jgi:hypothetical protein
MGVQLIIAILAAWRLTEILTMDRIFEPIRKRWPLYIWTCPRCVSVWSGLLTGIWMAWHPYFNLPLALSQSYILAQVMISWANLHFAQRGNSVPAHPQQLHIGVNAQGDIHVLRSDFNSVGVSAIMTKVVTAMKQQEDIRPN